jgi:hypothetical protein
VQNCLYFTIFAKGLFGLIKKSARAFALVSVAARLKKRKTATGAGFIAVGLTAVNGTIIHY